MKKRIAVKEWLSNNSVAIEAGCALFTAVILGLSSLFVSFQSWKTAESANELARTANSIARISNLPAINCLSMYNENTKMLDATFYNSGGAIKNIQVEIHSFFEFHTIDKDGRVENQYIAIKAVPLTAELTIDSSAEFLRISIPSCNYPYGPCCCTAARSGNLYLKGSSSFYCCKALGRPDQKGTCISKHDASPLSFNGGRAVAHRWRP